MNYHTKVGAFKYYPGDIPLEHGDIRDRAVCACQDAEGPHDVIYMGLKE